MADAQIFGGDSGRGGYAYDVFANAEALYGNNAIYTTGGAGGFGGGNVTFNPDLSSSSIAPNVIVGGLSQIPVSTWIIAALIIGVSFYLGKKS